MISKQEYENTHELTRLSNAQTGVKQIYESELDILVDLCCKSFNVSQADFMSPWRKREVAECRQVFFFMARYYAKLQYTLKSLGQFVGGRDHTTVLYGVESILDRLDFETGLNDICNKILLEFQRLNK